MIETRGRSLDFALHGLSLAQSAREANLIQELSSLRAEEFIGVVFGDIHLADVRAWYEERVIAAGLEHVEPIWGEPPNLLLEEFISSGGRAVITCVDLAKLDEVWLALAWTAGERRLDSGFAQLDLTEGG